MIRPPPGSQGLSGPSGRGRRPQRRARNTAHEGIRLLAEEGLVTAQHGHGVFVREKERLFRWGNDRYSRRTYRETGLTPFRIEMERLGGGPSSRVIAPGCVQALRGRRTTTDTDRSPLGKS